MYTITDVLYLMVDVKGPLHFIHTKIFASLTFYNIKVHFLPQKSIRIRFYCSTYNHDYVKFHFSMLYYTSENT